MIYDIVGAGAWQDRGISPSGGAHIDNSGLAANLVPTHVTHVFIRGHVLRKLGICKIVAVWQRMAQWGCGKIQEYGKVGVCRLIIG